MIQMLHYLVRESVLVYRHFPIVSTDEARKAKLAYILPENQKKQTNKDILDFVITKSKVSEQSLWLLNRHIYICFFSANAPASSVESLHCMLVLFIVLSKKAD